MDLSHNDRLHSASDDSEIGYERPEASESGIITEMEHFRSQSMTSIDANAYKVEMEKAYQAEVENHTKSSKGKRGRLSTRVARGIKKQLKTTSSSKSRHRSLSPPRSQRSLVSSDDDAPLTPPLGRMSTAESAASYEPKKVKHKSSYKQVAKAAAAAAKKVTGKKSKSSGSSGSSSKKDLPFGPTIEQPSSNNSSRASTPTNHLQVTPSGVSAIGKTPMNTPVNAANILDRPILESVIQELPATLTEEEHEDATEQTTEERSVQFKELAEEASEATSVQETTEPSPTSSQPGAPPAAPAPTEDEALKLAEAMALAVQSNPTKSQDEIRRIVYGQPEFKHLAPPVQPSASSSSSSSTSTGKLIKKNFMNLQNKSIKYADKAQKKLMETMESTLGGSTTSFPFSFSASKGSGSKEKEFSERAPERTEKPLSSTSSLNSTSPKLAVTSSTYSIASSSTPSIPEGQSLHMEHSVSTVQNNSQASLPAAQPFVGSPEQLQKPVTSVASASPPPTEHAATTPAELPSAPSIDAKPEEPIKLSDIVWKRRSGFGQYYSTGKTWERRRFILQGNVLSYYRAREKNADGEMMDDETERFDDARDLSSSAADQKPPSGSTGGKSSTKQRMIDALEQAATSLGVSASVVSAVSSEKPPSDGSSSARGYMDLIKENATVCATLGHSGAPSPFCLSIKVKGETKWKLCFASHRSQLQWMAAISDVVVQASVDTYNLQLLTQADPSNHDPTQVFQASVYEPPAMASEDSLPTVSSQPSVQQQQQEQLQSQSEDGEPMLPAPTKLHVSGRRLWMMEPYVIRAQGADGQPEEDDEDDDYSTSSSEEEEEETSPDKVELNDRNVWAMPEHRLLLAALIINGAILFSRNSATSVSSFWSLITVVNFVLFSFLESKEPPVATSATPARASAGKPRGERKSRKRRKAKKSDASAGGEEEKQVSGRKAKKEKFIPMAGMSTIRIENVEDPRVNAKGEEMQAWKKIQGEDLLVRSHGYLTTKAKVPSPGTLYELKQVDLFESPARYPDMAPRVKLPKLSYEIDPDEEKTWHSPDHFVVSMSIPTDPPRLGATVTDGGGYTATMYYTMRKETRDVLKRVTAEGYDPGTEPPPEDVQKSIVNGVRLFEEWCKVSPTDLKFQTRFKMVPNVPNAKEIGLPSWISKYNGKPFLIKRPGQTGFLLPHPELNCLEFDISLHVMPYLAKQGICYLKDTMFNKLLASIGFVIEGRDDDELPEVVVGCAQLCNPDPNESVQGADFFAGTAVRSFEPEDETTKPAPASTAAPVASPIAAAAAANPAPPAQPAG